MKIYHYPSEEAADRVAAIINRSIDVDPAVVEQVQAILADVKKRGDEALIEYANRFDSPVLTLSNMIVTPEEMEAAEKEVDAAFLDSLERAATQIESFHKKQKRKTWLDMDRPGAVLGQMFNPVDAAGVYVPGGQGGSTPLVSSVLMGVIPAKIAGVKHIGMATPSNKDGSVNPYMLAAARRVGVDAVYKVGSAWAIAALAYGTDAIPRCDVIVGPGNIYVTVAKKIVSGTVGIDMIAGPSEVLVIADNTANPEYTAADLLSQAEHDVLASAVLVTDSIRTAEAVSTAIRRQLEQLGRKEIAETSLKDYGAIMLVDDLDAAFDLSNRIAPEHLELHIESPFEHLNKVKHAGAVFMGDYTPEPVGDYIAGPNHVLPTAGTARFSSALSVDNFIKKTSVIYYSRETFEAEAEDIIRLAETEGLGAHANSVKVRLGDKPL